MSKKNTISNSTGDLESRITMMEARITALEYLSKKFTRKKRQLTDEQRAAIRARLLAGQENARKIQENESVFKPVDTSGASSTDTQKKSAKLTKKNK